MDGLRLLRNPQGYVSVVKVPAAPAASRPWPYHSTRCRHTASHIRAGQRGAGSSGKGTTARTTTAGPIVTIDLGSIRQDLEKSNTTRAVLELLQKGSVTVDEGPAAAEWAACLLCALARSLQPDGALQKKDAAEVQDAVARLVAQLGANSYYLTFHQLTDAVAALEALLPPLRWPRLLRDAKAVHSLLAALLPAAASAVRPAAKAPASLGQLCAAFRSVLQVVALMRSAGQRRPYGASSADPTSDRFSTNFEHNSKGEASDDEVDHELLEDLEVATLERASSFLRTEVFSNRAMCQRLAAADLASLASAVELADAYGLAAPRVFVEALTARVDSLVAEAVAARRNDNDKGAVHNLDVVSLARLVEAWCWAAARPQPTAASAAPEDTWLARMAGVVLVTQDTAAVAAWHAAYNRVAELRARLAELEGQLEEAKERLTEAKRAQAEAWRRASKLGLRGRKRKDGEGDAEADADAAGPAAGSDDGSAGSEKAAAELKAAVERLEAALKAHRLTVSEAEKTFSSLGPAPAATQQRLDSGALVALLAALSRSMGKDVGAKVGRRAEAVLLERMDMNELEPGKLISAFQSLVRMGHSPSHKAASSVLRLLRPRLSHLSPANAATLLAVIRASGVSPGSANNSTSGGSADGGDNRTAAGVLTDLLRALAVEGDVSGREGAGLGRLPSGVLLWLVRACEEWRVALPAAQVQQLEVVAVARAGRAEQALATETDMDADAAMMQKQLLSGVVLPLARTGLLRHTSGRAFAAALGCGGAGGGGVYRLDERGAALLLGGVRQEWGMGSEGRQALSALVDRSLALCLQAGTPAALVSLLLAAGRAVRVMASGSKDGHEAMSADAACPEADRLLPLALERLLRLQPSADQLAAVAHEYFVGLQWRGPTGPAVPQQARTQGKALLALLLKAATPQLRTCRLESLAMLLEACATAQVLPPPDWLTAVLNSASEALSTSSNGSRGVATAQVLLRLLDAVRELGGGQAGAAAAAAAATVEQAQASWRDTPGANDSKMETGADSLGSQAGTVAASEPLVTRRAVGPSLQSQKALLEAILSALLEEPASQAFRSDPSALVSAAWSLCGLGVRPPEPWLRSYMGLLQREGLGPERLAAPDLVALVQGLAGMRAAPPPDFIEALLLAAAGGGSGLDRFSPAQLGVLVSGVHTLWRDATAQACSAPAPVLSSKAGAVWDSAHALLKSQWGKAVRTYTAPELLLAADAVLAYELEPQRYRSVEAVGDGSGARPQGAVGEPWLQACCESLLQQHKAREAAAQPPVTLLINLLRLASRVLCGRSDGGVAPLADLTRTSTAAARIVEYVRICLAELTAAADGGEGAVVRAHGGRIGEVEWRSLLRAAGDAGIRPNAPDLGLYASALFTAAADRLRDASSDGREGDGASTGAEGPSSKAMPEGTEAERQIAWADLTAGLRDVLLPALPSVPHRRHVQQLQQGLAGLAPALAAATGEQLAALCTWVVQAGPEVAPVDGECWRAVCGELARRLQQEEAASGALRERERRLSSGFTATELAAVWYGLMAGGCDVPPAAAARLRGLLQAASAASAASDATLLGAAPSALRALSALQLLWVARSCGCLAEVPEGVWEVAYGGGVEGSALLEVLRPAQLAQMVLLWAERRRGGAGTAAAAAGQPGTAQSEAWLRALAGLYAKQGSASKQGSAQGAREVQDEPGSSALWEHEPPLDAAVAAHAVAHCLPRAPPGSPLPPYAPALCEAALPAVAESSSAADVVAFLGALEGRTGWAVPQQQLQALATRLAGAGGEDGGASSSDGATASPLSQLPAAEALQLALALVRAAPPSPEGLPSVLPVLAALAPQVELELYGMAVLELLSRAVLATGLEVGLSAVCELHDPSGWELTAASATEAAATLAVMLSSQTFTRQTMQPLLRHANQTRVVRVQSRLSAESAGLEAPSVASMRPPSLPPAQLAQAAAALISASGQEPLPRPAAALLMRLLAEDGVVELLPDTALEQALQRSLSGTGVPMPDTVAAALDARLRAAVEAGRKTFAFPVARGAALRRCGASPVWSHRALLELTDPRVAAPTTAQALDALAEMQASGVRERLAPAQRPFVAGDGDTADPPDGPYAKLLLRLLRVLFRLSDVDAPSMQQCATALRHCAALVQRLQGAYCKDLIQCVYDVAALSIMRREGKALTEALRRDPAALWNLLSAAQELGGHRYNDLRMYERMHALAAPARKVLEALGAATNPDANHAPRDLACAATNPDANHAPRDLAYGALLPLGAHLLTSKVCTFLWETTAPLLMEHIEACGQLASTENSKAYTVMAMPTSSSKGSPALLSARQLGQLFGVVALHSPDEVTPELREAVSEIAPVYCDALAHLAARTDLPPLEHLTAVLDALEPAVLANPGDVQLHHPYLYETLLKTELYLAPPLARVMTDPRVVSEPQLEGASAMEDILLLQYPGELSEQMLLKALFDYQHIGPAMLPLPPALQPRPGRHHGMPGDPDGDAAREAYVRSIAPMFMLARRVDRLIFSTQRSEAVRDALSSLGVKPAAGGRWARLLAHAVNGRWASAALLPFMHGSWSGALPGSTATSGGKDANKEKEEAGGGGGVAAPAAPVAEVPGVLRDGLQRLKATAQQGLGGLLSQLRGGGPPSKPSSGANAFRGESESAPDPEIEDIPAEGLLLQYLPPAVRRMVEQEQREEQERQQRAQQQRQAQQGLQESQRWRQEPQEQAQLRPAPRPEEAGTSDSAPGVGGPASGPSSSTGNGGKGAKGTGRGGGGFGGAPKPKRGKR